MKKQALILLVVFCIFIFFRIIIDSSKYPDYDPDIVSSIFDSKIESKDKENLSKLFDVISNAILQDVVLEQHNEGKSITLDKRQKKFLFWGIAKLCIKSNKDFINGKSYQLKGFPSSETALKITLSDDKNDKIIALDLYPLNADKIPLTERHFHEFSQTYISALLYDFLDKLD